MDGRTGHGRELGAQGKLQQSLLQDQGIFSLMPSWAIQERNR